MIVVRKYSCFINWRFSTIWKNANFWTQIFVLQGTNICFKDYVGSFQKCMTKKNICLGIHEYLYFNNHSSKTIIKKLATMNSFQNFDCSLFSHHSLYIPSKRNIKETSIKQNIWGKFIYPKVRYQVVIK